MIDVHPHCHLAEHGGSEWRDHWRPVYGHDYPDHTPADYDAAMKGVAAAFVFGIRATAAGIGTPNEYVEWFCASRHPHLTQIIAHLGHPWQRETIVTLRTAARPAGLPAIKPATVEWLLDGDPREALGAA